MKYLKMFEYFHEIKYNPGDYCLIKLDIRGNSQFEAKLLEFDDLGFHFEFFYHNKIRVFHNPIIIRKLTPDEIQEFELRRDSIKYNL